MPNRPLTSDTSPRSGTCTPICCTLNWGREKKIYLEDAIRDYYKLTKLNIDKITNDTRIGNNFVNYFTFECRLDTVSKKGLSFWDFIGSPENLDKPYIKKLMTAQSNRDYYKALYSCYRLTHGCIGLFKPCRVIDILHRYKINNVLDPFAGWGCRAVGCAVLGLNSYTGIDINIDLREPYQNMISTLQTLSNTKMDIMFSNCLDIDYTTIKYDCVFTSPPYYNTEIYNHMNKKTILEWNAFYNTIFKKTFDSLEVDGLFILNIPIQIYVDVLIPLLGIADEIIPLKKHLRNHIKADNENFYVWFKRTK